MYPKLHANAYVRPRDYIGATFYGMASVVGQSRDSGALERSNFRVALATLERSIAPADLDAYMESHDGEEPFFATRAHHWAVGWVETLYVALDAPASVLDAAEKILERLESYPVLDEDDFGEEEYREASEYWARASVADRVHEIQRCGADPAVSVFAARRSDLPEGLYVSDLLA